MDADDHLNKQDEEAEFKKRRKRRNFAILGGLVGWVVLIYLISIVRMGIE